MLPRALPGERLPSHPRFHTRLHLTTSRPCLLVPRAFFPPFGRAGGSPSRRCRPLPSLVLYGLLNGLLVEDIGDSSLSKLSNFSLQTLELECERITHTHTHTHTHPVILTGDPDR